MSLDAHIEALQRKHEEVDAEIIDAERSPWLVIGSLVPQQLKRQKLRIKDRIAEARAQRQQAISH